VDRCGDSVRGGNLQQLGVVMDKAGTDDDAKFWDEFFGIADWGKDD
jgi:hypothetical protein